jgi:hypothetical protein
VESERRALACNYVKWISDVGILRTSTSPFKLKLSQQGYPCLLHITRYYLSTCAVFDEWFCTVKTLFPKRIHAVFEEFDQFQLYQIPRGCDCLPPNSTEYVFPSPLRAELFCCVYKNEGATLSPPIPVSFAYLWLHSRLISLKLFMVFKQMEIRRAFVCYDSSPTGGSIR